jgi:hypothetical protein
MTELVTKLFRRFQFGETTKIIDGTKNALKTMIIKMEKSCGWNN